MRQSLLSQSTILEDQEAFDLTPMLDVMFILLIFFMATTSFTQEVGVAIERPQALHAKALAAQPISIAITADHVLFIDQKRVDIRQLAGQLRRKIKDPASVQVLVQADKKTQVALLTQVVDVVRGLGVDQIALATAHF